MPLPLRKVEPTYVCRGTLPEKINVPNDLEAVANGTLAHVILQLSSLSHNAEEMFSDLVRVATDISSRSASLQARLDRLAVKVNQLDGTQDECSMQDCLNTKPFQSSTGFDQQVVARTSMPTGMAHRYTKCDRPPPLEKLNGYRDDGKDGLKFYTDPNYFFELWRQEMLKDTEKAVRKQLSEELQEPHKPKGEGGRGHKKRVRQPVNTREKQKNMAIQHGEHFVEPTQIRAAAATPNKPLDVGDGIIYPPEMPKKASRPNSMEIKRVSFEGVDRDDEEHPEGLTHSNQYAVPHVHSKHDVVHVLPHAFVDPNEIKLARDKMAARNNNNAYLNNINNNNNNVTDSNPRRSWGSGTVFIVNGRRSSDSSDNSMKMNARRPSQPPPAPPSAPPSSSSSPGSSIPSNGGTPTARTNNIRVMKEVRETLPPPPPPPAEAEMNGNGAVRGSNNYPLPPAMIRPSSASLPPPPPTATTTLEDNEDDLPPPPPTPDQIRAEHIMNADLPAAPAHLRVSIDDSSSHNLPPAPPPPMSESPVPPPPPPPLLSDSPSPSKAGEVGVVLQGVKKDNKKKVVTVPVADGRDELLQAIRGGICLRKVDVKVKVTKEEKVNSTYGDVASILARRVALEMSDSDSGSSEYDSDGWDETSA